MGTLFNYHHAVNTKNKILLYVVLFVMCLSVPQNFINAENDKMSLTIAPPLFQLSLQPGETWSSLITVVNNNKYDLTVYANPVLFKPSGETGRPVFVSNGSDDVSFPNSVDGTTIVGWISVPNKPIKILREQTYKLPVKISVPKNAQPGGHYAAILIGNKAPTEKKEGGNLNVSSSIASLIFLTVAGDVVEDGRIRDFVTEKSIYENAEAKFSLRFENKGNVHIQPTGDITIYNMFNKKRGYIPINQASGYGNVLPGSIRKFTYKWKSDSGKWDIGRYRAVATIGYGSNKKQFVHSTVYFWVLPLVPLFEVLSFVIVLILFIRWSIVAYIKRAIAIERLNISKEKSSDEFDFQKNISTKEETSKLKLDTLMKPIVTGIVDLRNVHGTQDDTYKNSDKNIKSSSSFVLYIKKYKSFFIFILILIVILFITKLFFSDLLNFNTDYSAVEERPDGSIIELQSVN